MHHFTWCLDTSIFHEMALNGVQRNLYDNNPRNIEIDESLNMIRLIVQRVVEASLKSFFQEKADYFWSLLQELAIDYLLGITIAVTIGMAINFLMNKVTGQLCS